MKKLQNNFTTIEQSKRLLELGVPTDSADMYIECYWDDRHNGLWRYKIGSHEAFRERKQIGEGVGAIRPCWSVGRLIEIMKICNHPDDVDEVFCELAYSKKNLVELIVRLMEENKEITEFSKLEE